MNTYKFVYTETITHWFYVDAENKTEAQNLFEQGLMNGEFDFSNGSVDEADYIIEEDK